MTGAVHIALAYARIGWRVHPIRPGEKLPLLRDWPARASIDPEAIRRWWDSWPDANVAVATGERSGLFVLDVDGTEGERSLAELERKHGPLPDLYPMQWTGGGRGGWQAFFAWPGVPAKNSVGRLGRNLDTRGDGGYVLVPPSRTTGCYAWAPDRDPWTLPPEPAPDWLVDLLIAEPEPEVVRRPWSAPKPEVGDAYLKTAIATELENVRLAPPGQRNHSLNRSAFNLFRFVGEHRIDAGKLRGYLEQAALSAGLGPVEIARTLRSAAKQHGITL